MPRFTVLTHDYPFGHWDFLLEAGPALRTWRLFAAPDAGGAIAAEALADHRREYLDYQGPVSGGRGEVARWDSGEFSVTAETPDRLEIRLAGERLHGAAALVRTATGEGWSFEFTPDPAGSLPAPVGND
ncbi:MAG TPA: DNA polymerase ligase N-terminal domain-containing protein [Planctomycetaceae bacterium]|nr:DNA polymerase ligase N-terminal domain-containing protein [Planctomycetaceae bacterium]